MPLVINNLGGRHTHTQTHAYRHLRTEVILRTCGWHAPGSLMQNTQDKVYI